jgi:L-alanine-DL-glutamate epimerase-like enolase superfamily enzyme
MAARAANTKANFFIEISPWTGFFECAKDDERSCSRQTDIYEWPFRKERGFGLCRALQPDLSKCGGITEALKMSAMASAYKLPVHCHSSMGINMAATVHFMSAIENAGYFEADCSLGNPLRDELIDPPIRGSGDGTISPGEKPGIGIKVDEAMIRRYAGVEGPAETGLRG